MGVKYWKYNLRQRSGLRSLGIMAIPVVEFSNQGYKIRKILPKNEHTQRKLLNFENWVIMGRCQKLGIIVESKVMLIIKKCAPKLIFFKQKKLRQIWIIFGVENLL